MATYAEKQEYKVEIIPPYNTLQIRRSDIVLKDDVEIARSYHRSVCFPGEDVSSQPTVVQQTANAVWTDEVVAAYEASLPPEPEPEITTQPVPEPQPNEEESN
jgi:hypothetical protein